jgi:hypothetical protein
MSPARSGQIPARFRSGCTGGKTGGQADGPGLISLLFEIVECSPDGVRINAHAEYPVGNHLTGG